MSNLFKNDYHVYLYKYNYAQLRKQVESLFKNAEQDPYEYLFESFVTDLYSLGMPSSDIQNNIANYKKYIQEYKTINNTVSKGDIQKQSSGNTVKYTWEQSRGNLTSTSAVINSYRSARTPEDKIIQEALAQNYALQRLQKDFEDTRMGDNSRINWLNAKSPKGTYDSYLKSALRQSTKLLNNMFDPIINDIEAIQNGQKTTSDYVYCIELTDLSTAPVIDLLKTQRTQNSCDNFLNSNNSNRMLPDDVHTNALSNIGVINTDINQLTNTTSFTLRQDILLKYNIHLEPNDIIEITATNYNKKINSAQKEEPVTPLNRNTQFIGFITKLVLSNRYGQTSDITVTCEGISKLLALNTAVSSNAISPQFYNVVNFMTGKDKKADAANVNAYETFFSGRTAYDLFNDIMGTVLAARPVQADQTNYTVRYVSSPSQLKKMPYQYCKSLLVLYHLAVTISTIRECGSETAILIAKVDCNIMQTRLEAYLAQLRNHFNIFWSTFTTPLQLLYALAKETFLEIYEDRCGVLIMRTPRYNTWVGDDIINMEDLNDWEQSINDSELKSRSDYQWSIEYVGAQQNLSGGYYQNVPALLKYGFRCDAPKQSPNAQSEIECAIFGALDVTKENGKTRQLVVTVPMIQDYKLGRLYYFPIQTYSTNAEVVSSGCVGYLVNIASTIQPGQVDMHRLTFTYVRNAELLTENTAVGENYGRILNFNHLPDLEMFMNQFTEKDYTFPEDPNKPGSTSGLVAQMNRYWASYNQSNKTKFDNYIEKNSIVSYSERQNLWKTMQATNLSHGSFQGIAGYTNKGYIPTQQLINSIWLTDAAFLCGITKLKDILNISYDIPLKIKRVRDNEDKLLNRLNNDKTLGGYVKKVNYIDLKNKPILINSTLLSPYATVGEKFFINSSLKMNMLYDQELASTFTYTINEIFESYQNCKDNESEYYTVWITKKLHGDLKDLKVYNEYCTRMDEVKEIYNNFKDNPSLYTYSLLQEMKSKSRDIELHLEYMKENQKTWWEKFVDSVMDVINYPTGDIFNKTTSWLFKNIAPTYKKVGLDKNTQTKMQVVIPAVMIGDNSVPSIQTFNEAYYGPYIAGVCPIDYSSYFREIKQTILNNPKNFTIKDNNLYTATGDNIGTITELILDNAMSFTGIISQNSSALYFYPVVKYNETEVKKAYGISYDTFKNTYMTTKEELTNFAQTGSSKKYLAAVVVLNQVQVPMSKIPTIEQIANNDGLYIGLDADGIKDTVAMFDPSVLCSWTARDLENTFQVSIYNFIEALSGTFGTKLSCGKRIIQDGNCDFVYTNADLKGQWADIVTDPEKLKKAPSVSVSPIDINYTKAIKDFPISSINSLFVGFLNGLANGQKAFEINTTNYNTSTNTNLLQIKDIYIDNNKAISITYDKSITSDISNFNVWQSAKASESDKSTFGNTEFIKEVAYKEQLVDGLFNGTLPTLSNDSYRLYPSYFNCVIILPTYKQKDVELVRKYDKEN